MRHFVLVALLPMLALSCHPGARVGEEEPPPPRVAVFRCDVTPPPGEPLVWTTPLAEVEDPLWAKGIVLEDGRARYVVCAIDWCELCNAAEWLFRGKVAAAAGTDIARVTMHCVHQHAAPYADCGAHELLDGAPRALPHLGEAFLEDVTDRLAGAVKASLRALEPFDRVGTGMARVHRVASTRRIPAQGGGVIVRYSGGGKNPELAAAPEGTIDPFLRTITLARGARPLVRLHYYATHPQTFCCDGRASSDFVGRARETLEREEKVFQIYFTGCAGDVTVGKYNDGSPRARAELARRLLAGMKASIASTRFAPAAGLRWRTVPLVLPVRTDAGYTVADHRARLEDPDGSPGSRVYRGAIPLAYAARIARPLQLRLLRLGRVSIVHLPGEPMLAFQRYAQRWSPEDFVAVAAYGDGGPGYICTDRAFEEGGYEPTAANAGPGSEARLKAALRRLLGERPAAGRPRGLPERGASGPCRDATRRHGRIRFHTSLADGGCDHVRQ